MKTTLDHLPERKQRDLHTITTILRDTLEDFLVGKNGSKTAFRILKIILFGSHTKGTWVCDKPNGYISDYDILVIVNKAALGRRRPRLASSRRTNRPPCNQRPIRLDCPRH